MTAGRFVDQVASVLGKGVVAVTRYTVTAERGASHVWVLQCVEAPGALSETRKLSDAADLMREAISFVADVPEDQVEIELVPAFDAGVQ